MHSGVLSDWLSRHVKCYSKMIEPCSLIICDHFETFFNYSARKYLLVVGILPAIVEGITDWQPIWGQWLDWRCWVVKLGNSSTTLRSSDPGGW